MCSEGIYYWSLRGVCVLAVLSSWREFILKAEFADEWTGENRNESCCEIFR